MVSAHKVSGIVPISWLTGSMRGLKFLGWGLFGSSLGEVSVNVGWFVVCSSTKSRGG